jgi:transcriptional regulator with XRE-family HTH domain
VEKDPKKEFGIILKELRLKAKFSQKKLADYAELDRTYISDVERGLYSPTVITIIKIADTLEIRPSEFFLLFEKRRGERKSKVSKLPKR